MSHTAAARKSSSTMFADIDRMPWIAVLQAWLTIGIAALICVPAARGIDPWFGWLPFWLIVAPAIDLIVVRRHRLTSDAARWAMRFRQRRRWTRRQAMPLHRAGARRPRRSNAQTHHIR